MAYKSQPTVTRPANTTAYTAGDVVGGVISFPEFKAGVSALLTTCDLRINVTAIPAGMTSFRLHLYDGSPPSALADNAVFDIPSGDRDYYIGYVDLGSPADVGSTLFSSVDQVNKHICPGVGLYGYLVTNGAFTPAGNSEVYRPCLRGLDA
jgi:hypothetical protein